MAAAVTFNGFNDIDFSVVLNSLMTQASQPLTALQARQQALQTQVTTYASFDTQITAVQSAATDLSTLDNLSTFAATSAASNVVVSAHAGATGGEHDVVVNEIARAQITASSSTAPDSTTTVVASGGSITIGGVQVNIAGDVTLKQLAETINSTDGIGVHAAVIRTADTTYRLTLTGTKSGASNAFTVTNALSGGTGVAFTDTDGDGVSGDSPEDNAVNATSASLLVDNIAVTSESNTLEDVIPGVSLTVTAKNPGVPVHVSVVEDPSALKDKLQAFVDAYNSAAQFVTDQRASAVAGNAASIGRDPLVRSLSNALRTVLLAEHGSDGDTLRRLSEVGVEFTSTGKLQLNSTKFTAALAEDEGGIRTLLAGTAGVFGAVNAAVDEYSQADGLIDTVKTRLTAQISAMDSQIQSLQARLALQRDALQKQFTEADMAISRLKGQAASLTDFTSNLGSL